MTPTLRTISANVTEESVPEDVFGALTGDAYTQRLSLRRVYQHLAGVLHPDKNAGEDAAVANALFIRVTALRADAEAKIDAGTYGQRHVAPPTPPQPHADPIVVTTKVDKYKVGPVLYTGDVANLHECSSEKHPERRLLFKLARSAADTDLMVNEAAALAKVFPASQDGVDDYRLLSRLVEAFTLKDSGQARRVNVFERDYEKASKAGVPEHVSWALIRASHPDGLDFRDFVWMWKRALGGLGRAHANGYVHAAVLPEHLLVKPDIGTTKHGHGAKLVDWCYSVPVGQPAKAIVSAHRDLYAPEMLAKLPLYPETDIFMLAKCALPMLNADTPRLIRGLIESCLLHAPKKRPDNAWNLLGETAELLKKLVGAPEYRLSQLPTA